MKRSLLSLMMFGLMTPLAAHAAEKNAPPTGAAPPPPPPGDHRPPPPNISPEECARWEAMAPAERAAKHDEMRKKWDAMTPEQRKEKMDDHPPPPPPPGTHQDEEGPSEDITPGQAKSNRAHLREGEGIARPAGTQSEAAPAK